MKNKNIIKMEIMMAVLGLVLIFATIYFIRKDPKEILPQEEPIAQSDPEVDYSKIRSVSGKYSYEDENFSSMFGIDVAEFQQEIDWKKVKEDSVEFAYIRLGRRGATQGDLYMDDRFEANYEGARENGIKTGVYFFSQALDEKEAIEEAHFVLSALENKPIDLPIAYDLEEVFLEDGLVSRIFLLDKEQLTKNAIAFVNEIKKFGHEAIIYTYPYWLTNFYILDEIRDIPMWYAQYDVSKPEIDNPIMIWQYSNKGTINGISKDTDLNIMFIRKESN
ncbi:MAG: glycoside hydrolase family 25 protein [Erysipelotrichaceae bacterium]|nr:glycoside hydrolase family 25 protein [Erysipelotrichaceae bacterium]